MTTRPFRPAPVRHRLLYLSYYRDIGIGGDFSFFTMANGGNFFDYLNVTGRRPGSPLKKARK